MKKIAIWILIVLSLTVSLSSAYFAAETTTKSNRAQSATSKELRLLKERLNELEGDSDGFALLRETDGIIGLYDPNGKVLICTIDTPVISLPDDQRSQITVGLKIENPYDFLRLFENLSQ